MKYTDEQGDELGDHDDQLEFHNWLGYRVGVDRILSYIESIHAYPKLLDELKWAIKEGII